jgi:hypothetical protein
MECKRHFGNENFPRECGGAKIGNAATGWWTYYCLRQVWPPSAVIQTSLVDVATLPC